ncbi:MAG: anti-sigma factor [Pseudomonadota bacterium]
MESAKQEILAAEFALGTLSDGLRQKAEALLVRDAAFSRRVERWSERFAVLALALPPVAPPAELWRRIEAQITQRVISPQRAQPWRWLAIAATSVAAALGLYLLAVALPQPAAPRLIATLSGAAGAPAWLVTIDQDHALTVRPLAQVGRPGKALELWVVPPDGRPRSLGLLAADGKTDLAAPAILQAIAPQDLLLAVSAEPPGGSPTGQPTGPVLYTGSLVALAD